MKASFSLLVVGVLALTIGLEATLGGGVAAAQVDSSVVRVRVVARSLQSGSVEFGIGYGDQRLLPSGRFLTPVLMEQHQGEWLNSTPVDIGGPVWVPAILGGAPGYQALDNLWRFRGFGRKSASVQVSARVLDSGRIEFGILHEGELLLPPSREMNPEQVQAQDDRWLNSSEVEITLGLPPAEMIRDLSTTLSMLQRRDAPPIDIARVCTLLAVTSPEPSVMQDAVRQNNWSAFEQLYPSTTHRLYGGVAIGPSADPAYLYASQNYREVHWDYTVADYYAFIVVEEHLGSPAWWVAEFDCRGIVFQENPFVPILVLDVGVPDQGRATLSP